MMNFQAALSALKNGDKCSRSGWNAKGLNVYVLDPNAVGEFDITTPQFALYDGEKIQSWVPSVGDLFAEDWEIL